MQSQPGHGSAAAPLLPEVNPISLKVLRLCKPSFNYALPVPFPPCADSDAEHGAALSGMLALPQSFGDIFLGETFSCYISLCNTSAIELAQVGLKVEVQTQLQREVLSDSSLTNEAIERFASLQTLDRIIEYDLKDVGIHILICSALYTDSSGERKYFRKFFKFQVNNPLSMKSKTHALAPHNEVLVETQLQNAMPRQLFLKSIDFRPAPQFEVVSLNSFPPAFAAPPLGGEGGGGGKGGGSGEGAGGEGGGGVCGAVGLPTFGHLAYLKAGDTQQYMFRLKGKVPAAQLRQVSTLGRMDVQWCTAMGEAGRLQSNTVQRKLPTARGVEVSIVSVPSEVPLETPFELTCCIANTSATEMKLQLTSSAGPAQGAVVVDGLCTRVRNSTRTRPALARAPRMLPTLCACPRGSCPRAPLACPEAGARSRSCLCACARACAALRISVASSHTPRSRSRCG